NFIYWTTNANKAVARAPIGGGTPELNFIPILTESDCGVAVDDSHVYWSEGNGSFTDVGRANLDGTGIQRNFITGVYAYGIAVTPQYVFWGTVLADHSVGRANIDGTSPNEFFLQPATHNSSTPYLLAASPSNSFTLGKPKIKKNGTAVLKTTIQGPGVLV